MTKDTRSITIPTGISAVAEVGWTALRMEELGSFLPLAVRCVMESLAVDASGILELDPAGPYLIMRAADGCDESFVGERVPVGRDSLSGFTLLEGKPVVVEDMAKETRFRASPLMTKTRLVSGMCVCLYDRGRPYGVLSALSRSPRKYTSAEIDFLQVMANVISGLLGRLRDAEELEQSEARLKAVIESAMDAIVTLDLDLEVVLFNGAAEATFGCKADDAVGCSFQLFVAEDSRESLLRSMRSLGEGSGEEAPRSVRLSEDLFLLRASGEEFPAEISLSRVDAGDQALFTVVVRDITERLRAERALAEKDAQLAHAQKMEAVGRLAGGIAHDFNNVLAVVQGYGGALLDRFGAEGPIGADLSEILAAVQRGADLTRRLVAFGRRQVLQPRTLDLNEVVAGMEFLVKRLLGDGVTLQLDLGSDVGKVHADPGQIEHALMNLVLNARDAMGREGRLTIRTSNLDLDEAYVERHAEVTPGRYVMISVTDSGCGIDAESQVRIFEPFFTTKKEWGGTGLGLSTVHGIVHQSSGHVTVYSEPGLGTTFKIYLPRVDSPSTGGDQEEQGAIVGTKSPGTVLLVEDEEAVRGAIRRMLDRRGYHVIPQGSMQEALGFSRDYEGRVDVLVTDISMPGGSGPELADVLRVERPGIRVLFMSGYTDHPSALVEMIESGAAFLEKPFPAQHLDRAIRRLLEVA